MKRFFVTPIAIAVALVPACVVVPDAPGAGLRGASPLPGASAAPGIVGPSPRPSTGPAAPRASTRPAARPSAGPEEPGEEPELPGESPEVPGEAPAVPTFTVARVAGTYCTNAGSYGSAACYQDGDAEVATFEDPQGVAVGPDGTIYVADLGNHVIRAISPDGRVGTLAGSPQESESFYAADGVGPEAKFNKPRAVGVDGDGNVYVVETFRVRRVSPDGEVVTLAGSEFPAGFEDGQGSAARFGYNGGIAVTPDGTVYLADQDNGAIRRITGDGEVTTVADGLASPSEIVAAPDGDLYFVEAGAAAIRRLTADGEVATVAGGGKAGNEPADGQGAEATLRTPSALAIDARGDLYFNDTAYLVSPEAGQAGAIATWRRCTPDGVVTTIWRQFERDAAGQEIPLDSMDGASFAPDGSLVYTTGTADKDVRRVVFE